MAEYSPFFGPSNPQTIIAWRAGRAITIGALMRDAHDLAEQLPAQRFQLNLCENRYHFLVALTAAVLRGQSLLLPPSRAPRDLHRLARRQVSLYCLSDTGLDHGDLNCMRFPPLTDHRTADIPMPDIAAEQMLAELYTSGTTGMSSAHPKTWSTLWRGAELTGHALGLDQLAGASMLATVPSQHMYGLETAILLPLRWGLAISAEQPLFAADIASALNALPAPRILITTPLHLRCCIAERVALPEMAFILSATAPLPPSLAQQAEARYNTRILEIYGSTETGAAATRRPTQDLSWTPLPGVRLQQHGHQWWLSAAHLPRPVALNDHISLKSDGHFCLRGRHADLIKIAGKRASLADLNQQLVSIAGVEDGAFFHPDSSDTSTLRLVAFVVAPEMDEQRILSALRDKLDPAFLPRPLLRVTALPRNDTGKLARQTLIDLFEQYARPLYSMDPPCA